MFPPDVRERPSAQDAGCIEVDDQAGGTVAPLTIGRVASFYYLKHATMAHLSRALRPGMAVAEVRAAADIHSGDMIFRQHSPKSQQWPSRGHRRPQLGAELSPAAGRLGQAEQSGSDVGCCAT